MKRQFSAITLIIMSLAGIAWSEQPEDTMSMDVILFERKIGDHDQRLVVVREPDYNPESLYVLRASNLPDLQENYYVIRVELKSPDNDPVLLAARLRVEDGTKPDKGFVVLDALTEPGAIVLATAEGPDLTLWHIGIGRESFWTRFKADKLWTPSAAPYQLNEQLVGMVLGRAEDGRLTVEVTDKRVGQHTLYEENEKGSLRFKAVGEWVEKKPHPAEQTPE